MGIKPTLATSKYGYIIPAGEMPGGAFSVARFVEKPDADTAARLIEQDAVWNGGVFAFKLGYLMNIARSQIYFSNYNDVITQYDKLEKISFDYKVVEKAQRVAMVPFGGTWTDVGTWRTLADKMSGGTHGPVVIDASENIHAVNELQIPLVVLGAKDLVVAASPDGILVSDLVQSSYLKPSVEQLGDTRPMYEERRWGEYTVFDKRSHEDGEDSLVKRMTLRAGKCLSYQAHGYRDEVWTIVGGEALFVLDGVKSRVKAGDVLSIKRGQKHTVLATTDVHIVEVQLGRPLIEDDIERFDWDWNE
jgi:mannose-1-phosphate guanylyltransferase